MSPERAKAQRSFGMKTSCPNSVLTNIPFSDCTTGIKMMKKNVWQNIQLESKPIGWAFSFELAIKVYLKKYDYVDLYRCLNLKILIDLFQVQNIY